MVQEEPFQFRNRSRSRRELKLAEHGTGLVGRTVVHDDNLNAIEQRGIHQKFEALETRTDQILLVIDGNENRKRGRSLHGKSRHSDLRGNESREIVKS